MFGRKDRCGRGSRPRSPAHGAGLSPCARNTIREAISRDTSSSQHVGHAVRRNRTRSAAGTFSGHRRRSRRICHQKRVSGWPSLSDDGRRQTTPFTRYRTWGLCVACRSPTARRESPSVPKDPSSHESADAATREVYLCVKGGLCPQGRQLTGGDAHMCIFKYLKLYQHWRETMSMTVRQASERVMPVPRRALL